MKLGGLEAGGTKMVCAVGDREGTVLEREMFPTLTPNETIPHIVDFFARHEISALGVGGFGPLDLMEGSETYGFITNTPKTAWIDYPLLDTLKQKLDVPVKLTTDVNAAALAESEKGAAKGLDSCLYITVGTGIGAGAMVHGEMLHGLSHPEMGHISIPRHKADTFKGICSYHNDCLEGLAAGPAIEARWGESGHALAEKPEVWEMEAHYLAEALVQYILILMPKKIVLGGGVMKQPQLFPLIETHVKKRIGSYVPFLEDRNYIVPPGLGDNAGVTGALLLGHQALEEAQAV
ncbi:ROK family protein [Shouchella shacheensis]|uniref:ROK family protein n=1 Tax=Shouchella shacheensis TaxID=1649580 RepID=UPI0007402FA4|nr:ROK family protein [Shouchella shacheensis]